MQRQVYKKVVYPNSQYSDKPFFLQERTVVVLYYIHGKPEYETGTMTVYEDTEDILWNVLVKIGCVICQHKSSNMQL